MSHLVYQATIHDVQNELDNGGELLFRALISGNRYEILAYTPNNTFFTYCLMFKNDCLHSIKPLRDIQFPYICVQYNYDQDTKALLVRDDHALDLIMQFEDGEIDPTSHSFNKIDKIG